MKRNAQMQCKAMELQFNLWLGTFQPSGGENLKKQTNDRARLLLIMSHCSLSRGNMQLYPHPPAHHLHSATLSIFHLLFAIVSSLSDSLLCKHEIRHCTLLKFSISGASHAAATSHTRCGRPQKQKPPLHTTFPSSVILIWGLN